MRKAALTILALVVVTLVTSIVWWRAINAPPTVSIPSPPSLPSPNAFDVFMVAPGLERDSNKVSYISLDDPAGIEEYPPDPDDRTYSVVEQGKILNENLPMVQKIRQGLKYRYLAHNQPDFGGEPYYEPIREDGQMLGFASKVYGAKGDSENAMRCDLDAIQLGVQAPYGGALEGLFTGMSCQDTGRRRAWEAVDRLTGPQAQAAAARLESILGSQYPFVDSIRMEKWVQIKGMLETFNSPRAQGTVLGTWEPLSGGHTSMPDMIRLLTTSKQDVVRNIALFSDDYADRAGMPYAKAETLKPLQAPKDPLSRVAMGEFDDRLLVMNANNDTQNRLLEVALALRAYRVDHGVYPSSLAQLTPAYLHAIPEDPFALAGPIHYHRTGSKYVLYSFGPDGKDDGGTPITDPSYSGRALFLVHEDSTGDIVAGVNTN